MFETTTGAYLMAALAFRNSHGELVDIATVAATRVLSPVSIFCERGRDREGAEILL